MAPLATRPLVALAMIVKADDREAELLDRCLSGQVTSFAVPSQKEIDLVGVGSLRDSVDAAFITITGDNAKCEEVARKHNCTVSHFKWNHNFADARNFNFSQVGPEYKYIFWCDADDVIRHPELLMTLAEECDKDAVDDVIMNYLYSFDEDGNCSVKHLKGRFVRNDGCVTWAGEVHEDFAHNRELNARLNKEIEVVHLSDPHRVEVGATRNRFIAELAVQKNPKDPRSYWNLANTYLVMGRVQDAATIYQQFLQISKSDEERFLSWYRLACCYSQLGNGAHAVEAALEALALRPWYPDPYFLLGELNYNDGRYRAAIEFVKIGMTKEPPETESIVWNPLDYTYNPHVTLWKSYFAINKPRDAIEHLKACLEIKPKSTAIQRAITEVEKEVAKFDKAEEIYAKAKDCKDVEEIKRLLAEVPEEMKYYPAIVNLRNIHLAKKESSGKDVVIYCGYTAHEWNPEVADTKGVGGSEEAVIQLAKRFQKAGYNVTVYASTPRQQEYEFDGVKWLPFMAWNHRDKQDIVVLWRHPKPLDYDINAPKIYVDMHDVIPKGEFTVARVKSLTKVLFKSQAQRKYFDNVPDDKCAVIPHGLDVEEFDSQRAEIPKDVYHIINTSSPDRGLKTCLKIVKKLYQKLPVELRDKLKFTWHYGFDIWDGDFADDVAMMAWKEDAFKMMDELKNLGIMTKDSGGRVSQREITKKYLEAGVLLYPSEFFEIGFISGIKGALAGAIPFTTDVFAQGEFLKNAVLIHSDVDFNNWTRDISSGIDFGVQKEEQINEFVDKLAEYMQNPKKHENMRQYLVDYARGTFTWDRTAEDWINEFKS